MKSGILDDFTFEEEKTSVSEKRSSSTFRVPAGYTARPRGLIAKYGWPRYS